ncbi:MAG: GNAT family N-acetyltransferase [Gammaproteobacteria bacterium]|nr:GNAT family N-acetyltransferase [Gammaproteobacteria bacterium]MCW9057270.1 GNAT family N-acetyltransferase [Gammaproteobacteria bacterium]
MKPNPHIRTASPGDCRAIAELALIAGEGIPAYFWEPSRRPGQAIEEVGAARLLSETENFSYRNIQVAEVDAAVAGMLLAYRLPPPGPAEDLSGLPDFIRPLIELEAQVAGSYYINMLACFPRYRGQGIGTALMGGVDDLARREGCDLASIMVFSENRGALRLYQRLGYTVAARRPVIPHACHPYTTGEVLLLTRSVSGHF